MQKPCTNFIEMSQSCPSLSRMKHFLFVFTCLCAFAVLTLLLGAGCSRESDVIRHDSEWSFEPYEGEPSAVSIPASATLDSAFLCLYVTVANNQTIHVRRITAPWSEESVTWNTFGNGYDGESVESFVADTVRWMSVEVTTLLDDWLTGAVDNFGVLLDQVDANGGRAEFSSREDADSRPFLKIYYSIANESSVCAEEIAVADASIGELFPDVSNGSKARLTTGWSSDRDLKNQSLLGFEFRIVDQHPHSSNSARSCIVGAGA